MEAPEAKPRMQDLHTLMGKQAEGEPFVWPGLDGIPFRGKSIPMLKENDPESVRPQVVFEPFVFVLDLSNPQDLEDYRNIWVLVTNNAAVISVEERQYDQEKKNWRVFIRWALVYYASKQDPTKP